MAKIVVTITLAKTVTALNGATFDAIIQWVETNIIKPLPTDTEVNVNFNGVR